MHWPNLDLLQRHDEVKFGSAIAPTTIRARRRGSP